MDLTPEQRRAIYEEEKARLEAERVRQVSQPDTHTEEVSNDYRAAATENPLSKKALLKPLLIIGGLVFTISLIISLFSSDTPRNTTSSSASLNYSSNPTPRTQPTPAVKTEAEASASHFGDAKMLLSGNIREADITQAKEHLEKIPKTAVEYAQAQRILGDIKSKKIKPLSEFELENIALIDTIRDVDQSITYAKLKKNADKYIGQTWAVTGKILEIQEQGNHTVARIGLGGYGLDAIFVDGPLTTEFVEGNRVWVVGHINGTYSYESQAGWNITIPHLKATAMLTPADASRLIAAAKKR